MAACAKGPVLNGAPLGSKEDPVTPTTRSTIHRKDDSSSGEANIERLEYLKEQMPREYVPPSWHQDTAAETPRGQGLLEGKGQLMQRRSLVA